MLWKTRGMNRDMSVSAFNPEFSFENMNLRLSTNEGNTLMSWVNERGPGLLGVVDGEGNELTVEGVPVGTAVLNGWLVVFTTDNGVNGSSGEDRIYKFRRNGDGLVGELLFEDNLGFSADKPLETLVSYESEDVQKVYWVDGVHQPRVINIAGDSSKWTATSFDFVRVVEYGANFDASVSQNVSGGGLFAPGVIQYCFSYFDKNGQQSNIVWVSPLYYLTLSERGASPEEKVSNSFTITITDPDTNFEYVRIYSIQRTSLDLEPFVKRLDDIPIGDDGVITYVDNGTTGSSVDPTELLFIGGREILAGTLADKDGTLFLGDVQQVGVDVSGIQTYFSAHNQNVTFAANKTVSIGSIDGIYGHSNMLTQDASKITTFKGREWYRFGFQLQKKTGEWTEPIFIGDKENTLYPNGSVTSEQVSLVQASLQLPVQSAGNYDLTEYQRIRPLVVYPNIGERTVLCQGVLNPTVFNAVDRKTNSPFAQASWYFRPIGGDMESGSNTSQASIIDTITRTALTDDTTITVDSTFQKNQQLKTVYALTCTISNDTDLSAILKAGRLRVIVSYGRARSGGGSGLGDGRVSSTGAVIAKNANPTYTTYYDFVGAIKLDGTNNKYAFFSTIPWETPKEPSDADDTSAVYTDGVTDVSTVETPFKIYSGMQVTWDRYYYFPNVRNTDYTFEFFDTTYKYSVSFNPIASTQEALVVDGKSTGSRVRYEHYSSLYTRSDLNGDSIDTLNAARQIEVQGSLKLYDTPYTTSPSGMSANLGNFGGSRTADGSSNVSNRNLLSNTQFFIDQSIVTLNSPDIEFDTDVQRYGTEGFRLRIVGAIPITASASAHHIQTSSGMLETNHNKGDEQGSAVTTGFGSAATVFHRFGSGELDLNVLYKNLTSNNSGKRLVSEYLWNDVVVSEDGDKEDKVVSSPKVYDFLVHPWQRTGSLNNDSRSRDLASSWLKTKKESNILFSSNTKYLSTGWDCGVGMQIALTENDEVMNYRLPKQAAGLSEINYYANIDKVLYNEAGYEVLINTHESTSNVKAVTSPISMKYKSTSHAVLGLTDNSSVVPILPNSAAASGTAALTFWGDTVGYNKGDAITTGLSYDYLWLGELYKTTVTNRFGGTSPSALMANKWLIGGDDVDIPTSGSVTLTWDRGDTYYQRYDCLKTYPFTEEDTNQLVEILSFMCETHVNIDGRYDRNRGQVDNTMMRPRNFNLLNPVYSQQDNFFTYRKLDSEGQESQNYPNQVYYSMTKNSGGDVDMWTNVTLASMLELDGDKGKLNKLTRFNDQLLAFQDTGISQILYNENTAISSTAGVPIEIANSGKVTGKRYLSDTIGCQNKWSMVNSPMGIYFMDSHDKSIYLFNGQLKNLSTELGMNSWCKQNIKSGVWNPTDWDGKFVGHYDRQNQDVLFVGSEHALAYSEKVGTFTSFYDYGQQGFFENLDGEGIWLTSSIDNATYQTGLWGHQSGEYGEFFGEKKPYWMTLVGNPEPQKNKVFTNLEMRACVVGDGVSSEGGSSGGVEMTSQHTGQGFEFYLPFDELEVWDEYQHGVAVFGEDSMRSRIHHPFVGDAGNLKRKFRIWRSDVPRDNFPYPEGANDKAAVQAQEAEMGISRFKVRPLDRMRNPWVYLKLMKNAAGNNEHLNKTEVHDVGLEYFV